MCLSRPRRERVTQTERDTMTNAKTLTHAELRQFTGTDHWYKHTLNRKVLFTDGVKYLADQAGAYWLLDEITLIQPYEGVGEQPGRKPV
jgi:hypothetical protein